MKKLFLMVVFTVLFCAVFSYAAVTVSVGEYKKTYENIARFAIDAQEDAVIVCDGLRIVVPKGQKVIVRADVNEKGETIMSISGTGLKNIEINGYILSSTEKSFFTVNSKTGEVIVLDGYLTVKDSKDHIMFAAKNVPFTIDLSLSSDMNTTLEIISTVTDNDEKKQEQKDLSPSAPR